jgi:hypothetical protein
MTEPDFKVPAELMYRIDSLLSLMYHRTGERLSQHTWDELSELVPAVRKITDSRNPNR